MTDIRTMAKWAGLGLVGSAGALLGTRFAVQQLTKYVGRVFMTDPYGENIYEVVSATRRVGAQEVVEANFRAEQGKTISRPLGSPRPFVHFDGLMFNSAHLARLPLPLDQSVDTTVRLGPQCASPLQLDIPIVIAGMAYGEALSAPAKWALAKGAAIAGTATNSGEGPFLQKERDLARHFILQFSRANWSKSLSVLQQADMIEIQLGQGAIASLGHTISAKKMDGELRERFGVDSGEDAVIHSQMPYLSSAQDLGKLVRQLRELTDGVPIGCKFSFTDDLERDLEIALEAGVDVLALEGAQAATKGGPPVLEDDFGLPTIIGLCRAQDYLTRHGVRDRVSLLVAGGLTNPGHFLKALALGADAVFIGAIALFALTHTQALKAVPFEPPTQVVWYDGKRQHQFDWKQGAASVGKFLVSCSSEMADGARALGKRSLRDVNADDLVAIDQQTAAITGIPLAYSSSPPKTNRRSRKPRRSVKDRLGRRSPV